MSDARMKQENGILRKENQPRAGFPVVISVVAMLAFGLTSCGLKENFINPTSTPTISPTPTAMMVTPNDNLAIIINNASDGEEIHLSEGEFVLPQGLRITRSLTIIGAGADQTIIYGAAPGADAKAMFIYSGTGTLKFQGVTLQYAGTDPATVIYSSSGKLDLQDCVLTGATVADNDSQLGDLHLADNASATVNNCELKGSLNRVDKSDPNKVPGGIIIYGNSELSLQQSKISDSLLGVYAFGNAKVSITDTVFTNTYSAVSLLENSSGTMSGNTLEKSKGIQVMLFGKSSLTASGNILTNIDTGTGFQASENATAHLEKNTIQGGQDGILFIDNAAGEITGNEVSDTSNVGIMADGASSPSITDNTVTSATGIGTGINLQGTSASEVRNNTLTSLNVGIGVAGNATPLLDSNKMDNCKAGIYYKESAAGTANANQITAVELGILILYPAKPSITGNTVQAYTASISSDSGSWLSSLTIKDNVIQEITATPTVTGTVTITGTAQSTVTGTPTTTATLTP